MLIHLSTKKAAALALALGALTAGPAAAMQVPPPGAYVKAAPAPQAAVVHSGGAQLTARLAHGYGEHLSYATSRANGFTIHPPIVPSRGPSAAFNWGDAGIGAVGGLVLSMLGLGAVATTRRRPHHAAGRQVSPAATL